jgi:carbon monoxide dehydrogenase subunit G
VQVAHSVGDNGSWLDVDSARRSDPIVINLKGVTQVDRHPDWVFRELHDPNTLLGCVPGGSLTRSTGPRRFEARIAFGAGPFKLAYTGTGRIVKSDPRLRIASMTLNGHSGARLPGIRIHMAMAVSPHLGGSEIQMSFRVAVLDRGIGLLTRSWVDPIACDLLDRTIHRVKQRLEDTPLAPGPTAA